MLVEPRFRNFILTIPIGLSTNAFTSHQNQPVVLVATTTTCFSQLQSELELGVLVANTTTFPWNNQNINRDNVNQQFFLGADVPLTNTPMNLVSHAF